MSKAIPTRGKGEADTAYIERVFAAIYGKQAKRLKPTKAAKVRKDEKAAR